MPSKIYSFGVKHYKDGIPPFYTSFGGTIIDVRPYIAVNPHSVPKLRKLNGLDYRVQEYFFLNLGGNAISTLLPEAAKVECRLFLACTGGKHRSVFFATALGQYFNCAVEHLDIDKD
jgi:RNase adaptor protein for sRNA GlmZ degradation